MSSRSVGGGGSHEPPRGGNSKSTPLAGPKYDRMMLARSRSASAAGIAQDQPRFLFHGPAVASRTYAQARLHVVVEIADRDAGHGHKSFKDNWIRTYVAIAMQSSAA